VADKKIKKILVFALPRSGTTIIQRHIARNFKIPNLVEPFIDTHMGKKFIGNDLVTLYEWTKAQSTGIIKLLGINLWDVDTTTLLSEGNFDQIVIIERKNLTDCCISLYLANSLNKYHYIRDDLVNIDFFKCDIIFVNNWISMYKKYLIELEKIKNSNIPFDIISYDNFINDQVQYVAKIPLQQSKFQQAQKHETVATNLLYSNLCINYSEVEEKISKEILIC
jgi:hypothetical protein